MSTNATDKIRPKNRNIGTKVAEMEYNQINNLVNKGLYLNSADFLREAIREKLRNINEINIKEMDHDTAKNKIINYCKENQKVLLSDIADDLELDIFLVNDIIDELINEGRLKE
ncbi:MAG: hypothetical protein PHY33_07750 [Methanobacteriaceae archaeon]|jgi:Arc/MetJ-type ribon-helix-helix transcriptional regulator|nr:hypothetical protein [Methanobacteriaceae archaeon]MDD4594991.1 hypothetical protein [Methanobacteriaceae archaeon]